DGALSPEAMDATVKVLRRFHRVVRSYGSDRVRVVGTSALREASNSAAFLAWVQSAIGWKVETISGLEEGRLIHLGLLTNSRLSARRRPACRRAFGQGPGHSHGSLAPGGRAVQAGRPRPVEMARHRAASRRDHRRWSLRLCGTDGALEAAQLPLLAARPARRD